MTEQQIENEIIKTICQRKQGSKTVEEIIDNFNQKLIDFNPIETCFEIEDYFGERKGFSTSLELLEKDCRISKDWVRNYDTKKGNTKTDFKGLYVFVHEKTPFYAGISKAFNIGRIRYKFTHGVGFTGVRKDLNYDSEVEPVKQFLLKQKVAFINIDNDDELALFEIYYSMQLKTWLNSFETH